MSMPGLSLVGFMEPPQAIAYFRGSCMCDAETDDQLLDHWREAKKRLGPFTRRPGRPDLQDIPAKHADHLAAVVRHSRFHEVQNGTTGSYEFKLAEIAPLLAYQFHVLVGREQAERVDVDDLGTLLERCLPTKIEPIEPEIIPIENHGLLLRSRDLNFRKLAYGLLGTDANGLTGVGAVVGPGSPLTQIVRFGGRCILTNGYHRASQLLASGRTHIPALIVDAIQPDRIGLGAGTFSIETLSGTRPPTCAHLHPDRAYPVELRKFARYLKVTWAEFVGPE
jgi:hypothetical protein